MEGVNVDDDVDLAGAGIYDLQKSRSASRVDLQVL